MYFCEGRKLHNIFSHETHTRIMGVMLSHEMWPTVTYCCMSSLHRKGVNERHSLIMKIVCIFLNWESSLRLHRAVLLHITREGKKTQIFFLFQEQPFISHNNRPPRPLSQKREKAADGKAGRDISLPGTFLPTAIFSNGSKPPIGCYFFSSCQAAFLVWNLKSSLPSFHPTNFMKRKEKEKKGKKLRPSCPFVAMPLALRTVSVSRCGW